MIICYGEVKMMDDFIRPPKKEVKQEPVTLVQNKKRQGPKL